MTIKEYFKNNKDEGYEEYIHRLFNISSKTETFYTWCKRNGIDDFSDLDEWDDEWY